MMLNLGQSLSYFSALKKALVDDVFEYLVSSDTTELLEDFLSLTSTDKLSFAGEEKSKELNPKLSSLPVLDTEVCFFVDTQSQKQGERLILNLFFAAPAILSNLYIEGAITKFYPQYSLDRKGLEKFVKYFSWPGGFPSHVNVSFQFSFPSITLFRFQCIQLTCHSSRHE
jgi:hypothetical protein